MKKKSILKSEIQLILQNKELFPEPPIDDSSDFDKTAMFPQMARSIRNELHGIQEESSINKMAQEEFSDLIKELELPINKAELWDTRLRQWN